MVHLTLIRSRTGSIPATATNLMKASEKLIEWVRQEQAKGLQSIHVSVIGKPDSENLANEILDAIHSDVVECDSSL